MAAPPASDDEEKQKWTLIGPDGEVMTFGSKEEAAASLHPPAPAEEKTKKAASVPVPKAEKAPVILTPKKIDPPKSASSLLDSTSVTPRPSLALSTDESEPNLDVGRVLAEEEAKKKTSVSKIAPPTVSLAPRPDVRSLFAAPKEKEKDKDALPSTRRVPEPEELDSAAMMDDNSDDEEAPLSLKDAIVDDDEEEAPVDSRDIQPEEPSKEHEIVSLADMVVVPASDGGKVSISTKPKETKPSAAPPPPRVSATPPPAKASVSPSASKIPAPPPPTRGTLKTLPPTANFSTPPTITFEDEEPKSKRKPKVSGSARAQLAEEEPKRGWLLPAIAAAAGLFVVWKFVLPALSGPTPQPTPTPVTTATTTATPTPTPTQSTPEPPPTDTAPVPSASVAPPPIDSAPVVATNLKPNPVAPTTPPVGTAPVGNTPPATPPVAEGAMSMSEMLDKAGSARRGGDLAGARTLYERVLKTNGSNVEANGGLGDVARAQGDLQAAKASYERALSASPSYGPAQLGLADTEWDLGNQAGAQKRYAAIVERLGDRAPERAKQRGTVE